MATPDLLTDELTLSGRIMTASNATFLGNIGDVEVVYKPIAGESPLWDFPHGKLAHREVAAYLVSQTLGWGIVPQTWLRDGPLGEGMVQLWQEQDPAQKPVNLIAADQMPETGWKHVLKGQDQDGRIVALVHEDSPALRHMAVFDDIVNNADRKGDHILAMADGHRHGVDHGLTFHQDHKLRTVLWGWRGDALTDDEENGIDRVSEGLHGELGRALESLLDADEIVSLAARCARLRSAGQFPAPSGDMPAVPWPLF
ncbi:SCO1664 family protein [Paeniglutamicibacter gangotriensis]|uniref:SCO1664 family protein n=1 Tax=Paeniglutamicibacter gangotriensis TaxID=254787 RepID=A0A5B0EJP9_9MICC|nr:SCO1664 family protein [Paeniglutamicibacter gangotriensis]KAA0977960.1 SCO1664 family protein [Paeniglutamicibacter gangotriensis]